MRSTRTRRQASARVRPRAPRPHAKGALLTTPRLALPLLLSALVFVALLVAAICGERGFVAVWHAQREVAQLAQEVQDIEAENRRLGEEIRRLRSDLHYIENSRARSWDWSGPASSSLSSPTEGDLTSPGQLARIGGVRCGVEQSGSSLGS
ncbi:MAG: hypothetical protein KatS3mg131_1059 [Candidatus Tectimicrobiota bacterium]|nr:MAG: hypothetical protein KatS3mg131_1059 [Candidatus Tectomicrobia bacterium]